MSSLRGKNIVVAGALGTVGNGIIRAELNEDAYVAGLGIQVS